MQNSGKQPDSAAPTSEGGIPRVVFSSRDLRVLQQPGIIKSTQESDLSLNLKNNGKNHFLSTNSGS